MAFAQLRGFKKQRDWILIHSLSSLPYIVLLYKIEIGLSFPNSEHFGAAVGAYTLSCRFAILHGDLSGVFHLPLGAALHTICLHNFPPLVY